MRRTSIKDYSWSEIMLAGALLGIIVTMATQGRWFEAGVLIAIDGIQGAINRK